MVKAHRSLVSLIAAGDKSNYQWGFNPFLVRNSDEPIVPKA
jgi:hypothetical protein